VTALQRRNSWAFAAGIPSFQDFHHATLSVARAVDAERRAYSATPLAPSWNGSRFSPPPEGFFLNGNFHTFRDGNSREKVFNQ